MHIEHVNIVRAAVRALRLDKVLIMPTACTPQKGGRMTADVASRMEMCRLAFACEPCAEVCEWETDAGGTSYSYVTCERFAREYAADNRYFIVGCDMLENFPSWREPQRILSSVKIAVCAREDAARLSKARREFYDRFKMEAEEIDYTGAGVSSTRCRVLAAAGESLEGLVPHKVAAYAAERGLYRIGNIADVKSLLKEERWRHTVRVAFTAAENCGRIGWDERSAVTAALLHDCAKNLKPDSPLLSGFVPPEGVPASVLHQFSGAFVAEHFFGITDDKILAAIRYHTSGRAGMSAEEQLIYLSDMLEEGRNFPGVDKLRALFRRDIRGAMAAALAYQLKYLKSSGGSIYGLTREAYDYFKENI